MSVSQMTYGEAVALKLPAMVFYFAGNMIPDIKNTKGICIQSARKILGEYVKVAYAENYGYGTYNVVIVYPDGSSDATYLSTATPVNVVQGDQLNDLLNEFAKGELTTLHDKIYHAFNIGTDNALFVEDKEGKIIPARAFMSGKKGSGLMSDNSPCYHDGGWQPLYGDGLRAKWHAQSRNCLEEHHCSIAAGLHTFWLLVFVSQFGWFLTALK